MAQQAKATLHRWEAMPRERLTDKLERRMITGDRMMIAHIYLKKGCLVPRHHHENEQITYILEGGLRFGHGAVRAANTAAACRVQRVHRQFQGRRSCPKNP